MLYLELGVGYNTPGIIKYPFWQATYDNPRAHYVTINRGEGRFPADIAEQALAIDADILDVVNDLGEGKI